MSHPGGRASVEALRGPLEPPPLRAGHTDEHRRGQAHSRVRRLFNTSTTPPTARRICATPLPVCQRSALCRRRHGRSGARIAQAVAEQETDGNFSRQPVSRACRDAVPRIRSLAGFRQNLRRLCSGSRQQDLCLFAGSGPARRQAPKFADRHVHLDGRRSKACTSARQHKARVVFGRFGLSRGVAGFCARSDVLREEPRLKALPATQPARPRRELRRLHRHGLELLHPVSKPVRLIRRSTKQELSPVMAGSLVAL